MQLLFIIMCYLLSQVVKQCCATDGVEPQYIKDNILPPFFKHFWNQRMALDRRNYRQVLVAFISLQSLIPGLTVNLLTMHSSAKIQPLPVSVLFFW